MKYENEDAKVTAACIYSADILESWKYTTWKIKFYVESLSSFFMNVIRFAVLKSQYINLHTHSASRVVQNNKTTLYVAKIVPNNEQGENEEKEENSSQII